MRTVHSREAYDSLQGALRRARSSRPSIRAVDRLRRVGRAGDARSSTTGPTSAPTTSRWPTRCSSRLGPRATPARASRPLLRLRPRLRRLAIAAAAAAATAASAPRDARRPRPRRARAAGRIRPRRPAARDAGRRRRCGRTALRRRARRRAVLARVATRTAFGSPTYRRSSRRGPVARRHCPSPATAASAGCAWIASRLLREQWSHRRRPLAAHRRCWQPAAESSVSRRRRRARHPHAAGTLRRHRPAAHGRAGSSVRLLRARRSPATAQRAPGWRGAIGSRSTARAAGERSARRHAGCLRAERGHAAAHAPRAARHEGGDPPGDRIRAITGPANGRRRRASTPTRSSTTRAGARSAPTVAASCGTASDGSTELSIDVRRALRWLRTARAREEALLNAVRPLVTSIRRRHLADLPWWTIGYGVSRGPPGADWNRSRGCCAVQMTLDRRHPDETHMFSLAARRSTRSICAAAVAACCCTRLLRLASTDGRKVPRLAGTTNPANVALLTSFASS